MDSLYREIDYTSESGLEDKEQYHIRCKRGEIAKVVLVPGDPGRVETIVERLRSPRKIADNRGLVTYSGSYDGTEISVTSTGMGGPSAAIVYEELINCGAQVLVRVGSVAALKPEISPGDLSLPYACIRDDGASGYYVPENYPAAADPRLYHSLLTASRSRPVNCWTGINWTHSAFYARSPEYFRQWVGKNVITMEMEAATLMIVGTLRGVATAFIGTVFENRIRQTDRSTMDLSVVSYKREEVAQGVKASIEIALEGSVNYLSERERNKLKPKEDRI
jgi:uridine phosphorylase